MSGAVPRALLCRCDNELRLAAGARDNPGSGRGHAKIHSDRQCAFGSALAGSAHDVAHAGAGLCDGRSERHHGFCRAADRCHRPLGAMAATRRRYHQHLVIYVPVIFGFCGGLLALATWRKPLAAVPRLAHNPAMAGLKIRCLVVAGAILMSFSADALAQFSTPVSALIASVLD